MTLTIPPSMEQTLTRQAQQQGTTPEALALSALAHELEQSPAENEGKASISAQMPLTDEERQARIDRFLAWADRHATGTPLLSDDAISREAIYARDEDLSHDQAA
jgi:hypothetical protein